MSDTEYTPTTEDVKFHYVHNHGPFIGDRAEWGERFDRWLSAHDEAVAAKARREALEEAAGVAINLEEPAIAYAIQCLYRLAGGTESEVYPLSVNPPKTGNGESETTSEDVREALIDLHDDTAANYTGHPIHMGEAYTDAILARYRLTPRPVEPEGQA